MIMAHFWSYERVFGSDVSFALTTVVFSGILIIILNIPLFEELCSLYPIRTFGTLSSAIYFVHWVVIDYFDVFHAEFGLVNFRTIGGLFTVLIAVLLVVIIWKEMIEKCLVGRIK